MRRWLFSIGFVGHIPLLLHFVIAKRDGGWLLASSYEFRQKGEYVECQTSVTSCLVYQVAWDDLAITGCKRNRDRKPEVTSRCALERTGLFLVHYHLGLSSLLNSQNHSHIQQNPSLLRSRPLFCICRISSSLLPSLKYVFCVSPLGILPVSSAASLREYIGFTSTF